MASELPPSLWTLWPGMGRSHHLASHCESDVQWLFMEGQLTGRSHHLGREPGSSVSRSLGSWEQRDCTWSDQARQWHRKSSQEVELKVVPMVG